MRVEVTASLGVDQTDGATVLGEPHGLFANVVVGLEAVGVDEPVVVSILVVVASNLLLLGTLGVGLNVRVEKAAAVAHILNGGARSNSKLQRAVLSNLGTAKVGLEERAHLSIAGTAVFQDQEVEPEGEQVDHHGDHDERKDTETEVGSQLDLGHPKVSKLVPEILDSVQTDQSGSEETNPLDTADAANGDTAQHKPETPLGRERIMLEAVELGPAEDGGEGKEQKHRVEKDEPANGRERVVTQDHQRGQPACRLAEVQLLGRVVCQGNAESTEGRVEGTHKGVVELLGVDFAGLELEGSIVTSQVAREANQHLSERRVDIEIEFALEVVGAELAEAVHLSSAGVLMIPLSGGPRGGAY